jgi:Ca2+/Na+ antiporter
LIIENFLLCPPVLFGHIWGFFYVSRTCPSVWGVILAKVIFKKRYQAKMGPQRIYFSLTFMRVFKVIIHSNKIKLLSHLMGFFFLCFCCLFSFKFLGICLPV